MITANKYTDFIAQEYLGDFIREGGAAVKFAIPLDGATPADLESPVREAALASGYIFASVDARHTRVHMIEQVFFEIAKQIDWDKLARAETAEALSTIGFAVDRDEPFNLENLAHRFNFAPAELRRDLNRQLQEGLMRDYAMAREFRTAMLRLCQAQFDASPPAQSTRQNVLDWLTGEMTRVSVLKPALIFRRITRANARHMLFSLGRWIRRCGYAGLVLTFDISQLSISKRSDVPAGWFYTMPGVMDAYEVLRQLVDGTDELEACFVLVIAAPEFVTDERRGVQRYDALKLRIWDEVRDRRRANLFAALVRITPDAQVGEA